MMSQSGITGDEDYIASPGGKVRSYESVALLEPQDGFDGTWLKGTMRDGNQFTKGVISGNTLVWNNGDKFNLTFLDRNTIEFRCAGIVYYGELRYNGELRW